MKPWLNEEPMGRCKLCKWYTKNEQTPYCSDACRDRDELLSELVYIPSTRIETPLYKRLAINMSELEYREYKRKYGSCMDEDRGYQGGVISE